MTLTLSPPSAYRLPSQVCCLASPLAVPHITLLLHTADTLERHSDTGVVSGALLVIRSDLGGRPLSLSQESGLVSSALCGALAGSIAASRLADWSGRKPVIVDAAVLFAVGALEQAAAQSFGEVIFGAFFFLFLTGCLF